MSTTGSAVQTVNIYEAKTKLSKLVDLAAGGTDVVIARAGKPVARLTTLKEGKRPLVPGLLEGQGWIADDFNAPLPDDLQAAFEGR
jgi:prevent-host-death family protein